MNINNKGQNLSYIAPLALLLVFLFSLQISVLCVPRGSRQPWNEINPSSFGGVNPFNGAMSMQIPLINIGGRGDAAIPLTLRFEKPWIKYYYTYIVAGTPEPYSFQVNCKIDDEGNGPTLGDCVDLTGSPINATNPHPVHLMVLPRLDTSYGLAFISPSSGPAYTAELGYGPGLLTGQTIIGRTDQCTLPPPSLPNIRIRATSH